MERRGNPIKRIVIPLVVLGLSSTALSLWIKNSRLVVWAHANEARRRRLHRRHARQRRHPFRWSPIGTSVIEAL